MLTSAIDSVRSVISFTRTVFIPKQDLDGPIKTRRSDVYPEDSAWNRAVVYLRHSLGQRTQFRLDFYVLARSGARTVYKRLRKQSVFVNVGDPTQAELAIEAILSFAQSLDGKWLAPAESAQAVDTQAQTQSAGDSQAIGTASAQSEPEPTAAASSESVQDDEAQGFSGS